MRTPTPTPAANAISELTPEYIARLCGVGLSTVYSWRGRGIPAKCLKILLLQEPLAKSWKLWSEADLTRCPQNVIKEAQ